MSDYDGDVSRNRAVLIVDADKASRDRVADILSAASVPVAGACGFGVDAIAQLEAVQPGLTLVGLEAPTERAIHTIRTLQGASPDTPMIVYTPITDISALRQIVQMGVKDILPQPLSGSDLLKALGDLPAVSNGAPTRPVEQIAGGIIVTVFGARGGIGKSTIATNVATAITHDVGRSAIVIDLDTRFGDIALMMGLEAQWTISDVIVYGEPADRQRFLNALTHHASGVAVLAAPNRPSDWQNVSAKQLREVIEEAAQLFDFVILDTPAALTDIAVTAIEMATRILMVTDLDVLGLKGTASMLDLLDVEGFPDERILLTVNRVHDGVAPNAKEAQGVLHKQIYAQIPHDPRVREAAQLGEPVVLRFAKSRAAKELVRLAHHIAGTNDKDKVRSRGSLLSKFLR